MSKGGGKSFHKKDWAITAAALAAAVAAPYVAPALFGATGAAGAGAAGAAGAGAAGAGAGMMGGGTAASLFGPTAAGAELLGTFAPSAASTMTPMFTSLASTPAIGGSSIFGAGQGATALSSLGLTPSMSEQSIWQMLGNGAQKGLKGLEQAQKYQKLAQKPEQQAPPMGGRPQFGGGGGGNELAALSSLLSNPVGQAQLQRFLKLQGLA